VESLILAAGGAAVGTLLAWGGLKSAGGADAAKVLFRREAVIRPEYAGAGRLR